MAENCQLWSGKRAKILATPIVSLATAIVSLAQAIASLAQAIASVATAIVTKNSPPPDELG